MGPASPAELLVWNGPVIRQHQTIDRQLSSTKLRMVSINVLEETDGQNFGDVLSRSY
jgi:hypothetical protein